MTIRATTRRERIRRPDGSRVVLPGAQPATGLSAFAAVSAGANTISGAAVNAVRHDVMEPAAEAVVMFENFEGAPSAGSSVTLPAGVTLAYGNATLGFAARRENSQWGVARCDVDVCDDPQSQAGPPTPTDATDAPDIFTFATPLARALANAEGDPAGLAWVPSRAPVRTNEFPSPTPAGASVPLIWGDSGAGALSAVAAGGWTPAGRFVRLTGAAPFGFVSGGFGIIRPGETKTLSVRVKGTAAGVVSVRLGVTNGPWATSVPAAVTTSWVQRTVTYTHPVDGVAERLTVAVLAPSITAGQTLDVDGVDVMAGSTLLPYVDGATVNPVTNPNLATVTAGWAAVSGTLTRQTTGGPASSTFGRVVATAAGALFGVTNTAYTVVAGEPYALSAQVRGTVGRTVRLLATWTGAVATNGPTVAVGSLTAWQTLSMTGVVPAGATGVRLDIIVAATGVLVGDVLEFGAALGSRTDAIVGPFFELAAWAHGANVSQSATYLAATGTYTRPVDAAAPQLGLTGSKWVHRRSDALSAGDRLSSPWSPCCYRLVPRAFTIAGWLAVTPNVGVLPSFRWVVELILDPVAYASGPSWQQRAAVVTFTGPAFSPSATYTRAAFTLDPANMFTLPPDRANELANYGTAVAVRAHLEVIDPGTIGATAAVSLRGVHLYAGPDRGDPAGLAAVPFPAPLLTGVVLAAADQFKVTRIDVHGNDRVSHITAAVGTLNWAATYPDGTTWVEGSSAGRLTMRAPVPALVGNVTSLAVVLEEASCGPGGQASLQQVQGWHEVDMSADVVGLVVDRASDTDPSSSTVPIGNYAASTIGLTLDDTTGEYELFGRRYIDLGHRIEAAVGVVYTNRCDDPSGVATNAGAVPSLTWPSAAVAGNPVTAAVSDTFGQEPPAAFVGRATADAIVTVPMRVTSAASEGWRMRGSAWVRYTGTTPPPTLTFAAVRRFAVPGAGVSVVVDPASSVAVPFTAAVNVWTLVQLPAMTVPLGSNAVALSGNFAGSSPSVALEIGAPVFERLDSATGDVIEVMETAPGGIYSSTSWDAATGGGSVQVAGIDRLATGGALDLSGEIHVNTTVEAELRDIARRYLDLGSDQVVVVDQGTPLAFALPAAKVSTQIADLAKCAALTAFTDGAGRFSAFLRAEVDASLAVEYLSDRNLVTARGSIAPDIVKNDVSVTAHLQSLGAFAELGVVGRDVALAYPVVGWQPSADILVGAGETIDLWVDLQGVATGVSIAWEVITSAPGSTVLFPFTTNVAPAQWSVTTTVFPTSVKVTLTRALATAYPVYLSRLAVAGVPLVDTPATKRFERTSSVAAFGRQPVAVDVRLAQSTALLGAVALDVLDNYSLRDSSGERWLPDLEVEVLGDPWRELGDRVLVNDPDSSIVGEYRVLQHAFTLGVSAKSDLYLRRVPTGLAFAVADVSLADDGKVASY